MVFALVGTLVRKLSLVNYVTPVLGNPCRQVHSSVPLRLSASGGGGEQEGSFQVSTGQVKGSEDALDKVARTSSRHVLEQGVRGRHQWVAGPTEPERGVR